MKNDPLDTKRLVFTESDLDGVWIAGTYVLVQTKNGNVNKRLVFRMDARENPVRLSKAGLISKDGFVAWEPIDPPSGFTSAEEAAKYAARYATSAAQQMTLDPRRTAVQEPRRGVSRTNRKKDEDVPFVRGTRLTRR